MAAARWARGKGTVPFSSDENWDSPQAIRWAPAGWPAALVFLGCGLVLAAAWSATAADKPPPGAPPATRPEKPGAPATGPATRLENQTANLPAAQQQLADQYKELEKVLMRMRDLTRASDPRRAVLIEKALKESGDRRVDLCLDEIVKLLHDDQLSRAMENQSKVDQDLRAILELLLSENRTARIESEKARYRKYLERINRLLREQKDIQGRTAGGDDPKHLSGEQGELAQKTGKLSEDIQTNEENKAEGGKEKAEGGKGKAEGEKEKAEGEKGKAEGGKENAPKNSKSPNPQIPKSPNEGEKGKAEGGKENAPQNPKSPNPQIPKSPNPGQGQGQPQGDQQAAGQPPQDQNPVRQRLDAARQRMKDAQKKLDEAKRQGAFDEQEKAIRELEQARSELEEILRQLREEEMKRLLAMLEARFQQMLQAEREVYEGTVRLDKVPQSDRTHSHEIEAGRLSNKQTGIIVEVDKALLLLREEGSAVALPEAVRQMRDDMQQVVHRLAQDRVDTITQTIERDILAALEEIIDALKKAQKDMDNRKKPPGQSPSGQPQDPPLIDVLAELKMIRALQMRVNRRTERYAALVGGEQTDRADLVEALQHLAEQQQRIYKVTRDLELGKNK
ncbi:MAG: hypothetical protein ABSF26_09240 [Thermoguttaceae bacterium]|jgi:hypothetical protein